MEQASDGIRIVVLNGSVRPGNYTRMASALVVEELRKDPQVSVDVIYPEGLALPPPGTGLDSAATRDLQSRVLRAAGVVLATPEYHGSFSSVMKLMIENLGFPSVLAGKTVALLGVAAGSIGAIKSLEHLRGVVPQDILAGRN
jgi:chromate reductase, NAD(P)H dehydrogenase (quinone)